MKRRICKLPSSQLPPNYHLYILAHTSPVFCLCLYVYILHIFLVNFICLWEQEFHQPELEFSSLALAVYLPGRVWLRLGSDLVPITRPGRVHVPRARQPWTSIFGPKAL